MSNPRAPERGFTLIEVLVALAIVTIALSAAARAAGSAADLANSLRERQAALSVACDELARLRASPQERGRPVVSRDQAGETWTPTLSFSPGPLPGLTVVLVEVRSGGRSTPIVRLTGLLRAGR